MGLFKRTTNTNTLLIRQILNLVPPWMLARCAEAHKSDKGCSRYKTFDQFVALTFGQLNKCFTLSDISTGIGVSETFISSLGLDQSPARSTMGDGNKKRSYKVFETLYNRLLTHYGNILSKRHQSHIIEEIKDWSIKLIDSTVISLCLSMFDWAIPIANGTDSKRRDKNTHLLGRYHDDSRYGLEQLIFAKGTITVEDRAYFDFLLMLQRVKAENVFVTRIKTNTVFGTVRELELPRVKAKIF
jgi:hypothetical protein